MTLIFIDADLTGAIFDGASLQGAKFDGAVLIAASFRDARLASADLTQAVGYESADFSGACISMNTLLPTGLYIPLCEDALPSPPADKPLLGLVCRLRCKADIQLFQLPVFYWARCLHHEIARLLIHREQSDVANILCVRQ